MSEILCEQQKKGQNKINFDPNNMQLNHRKLWTKIRFLAKTYETNQEKGQYRSIF